MVDGNDELKGRTREVQTRLHEIHWKVESFGSLLENQDESSVHRELIGLGKVLIELAKEIEWACDRLDASI